MRVREIFGSHHVTTQIAVHHDPIALRGTGKTCGTWNVERDAMEIVSLRQARQHRVLGFHVQAAHGVVRADRHPAVAAGVNETRDGQNLVTELRGA